MTQEVRLRRTQCNYQSQNARFLLDCNFSKQYCDYYLKRLEKTRPFLEFNCRSKWNPSIPIYNLCDLAEYASCVDLDDALERGLSPASISPAGSQSGLYGSFRHAKRMRRYSQSSSQRLSPFPKTSTQIPDNQDNQPTPSTSRSLASPIFASEPKAAIVSPVQTEVKTVGDDEDNDETWSGPECIIIGTISKRMKLQPDVVKELSSGDFHIKRERYHGHYVSQDDRLVLEDEFELISLTGNIDPKRIVTGVVVALLGVTIDEYSQFFVRDICYAEPNQQILYDDEDLLVPSVERPLESKPIYLLLISGLGFHHELDKKSSLTKAMQNLIDFIWGGGDYEDDDRSSQVARILVVGDNLSEERLSVSEMTASQEENLAFKLKKSRQVREYTGSIQAVKHMDDFFAQLSKTIYVDVMPGGSDPTTHLMPQQPFHPCMFPKSCVFPTFNCTTNPYHAIYNDNVELLATSGQNIDIISKFSGLNDPIEIMKCHLMWGNCAPSAPDVLYSVPYEEDDPFVIDFISEVYVAGCQDSYRAEYYNYTKYDWSKSTDNETDQGSVKIEHGRTPSDNKPSTPSSHLLTDEKKDIPLFTRPKDEAAQQDTDNANPPLSRGKKTKTLLVTVPKFQETYSCVLLDLNNISTKLISFR